jgi:hypothetical protein
MTTRSTRLVAHLVLLLALASGVSLASSGPAIAAKGKARLSTSCAGPCVPGCRCVCCGRDANGHCNHQCCG